MHILHIQNVTTSNLESFRWSILFFWYIFCFLGTRYRFFQRVTAFLNALPPLPNALPLALPYIYWKSVSFSNTLTFLVHDQMDTVHGTTHFEWNKLSICTIFNALPRVTIKFLKKKYTITFFYKIDGNAW